MTPAALVLLLALQWFGGREPNTREGADHFEGGRLEEALRAFSRARDAHPDAVENDLNIAGVHYRMGEAAGGAAGASGEGSPFAEAIRGYQAAIAGGAAGTARRDGFFNLGNALYRSGAFEKAAAAYAEAVALDPEDREARQNLERALLRARERDERQQPGQQGDSSPDSEEREQEERQDQDERQERPEGRGQGEDSPESRPPPEDPSHQDEEEQRRNPGQAEEPESAEEPPERDRESSVPSEAGGEDEAAPGEVPEISPEQAARILAALAEVERAWQEEQLEKRRARALRRGRH